MSDLTDSVEKLFTQHCTDKVRLAAEAGTWPEALWQASVDMGLHLALVDTGPDALGLSTAEAFAVLRLTGAHAVPLPLAETMLANWLLAQAGMPARGAPTVIAYRAGAGTPWGEHAAVLQRFGDGFLVHERGAHAVRRRGTNIANEPRIDLDLPRHATVVPYPAAVTDGPAGVMAAEAALRTAQIAGAIDWLARTTVDYASTRVQFGKPIGKFQAVQHSITLLAEQAAATAAAADMAAEGFSSGLDIHKIAAAKAFASEAAGVAAGLAHQVHGAIGFSREHGLHHRTRRLWSWRDEAGNEAYWWRHLGDHLAGKASPDLWQEITRL
jgi:acyl-CoA dehydrogenase